MNTNNESSHGNRITIRVKTILLLLGLCGIARILFLDRNQLPSTATTTNKSVLAAATATTTKQQQQQQQQQQRELPFLEDHVCYHYTNPAFRSSSTSSIWGQHLQEIMEASHHPKYSALTEGIENQQKLHWLLREVLTPSRLTQGVRHLPTPPSIPPNREGTTPATTITTDPVQNVISIVHHRIRDPHKYPPLKIAVLGGSVTIGRGCNYKNTLQDKECAWPRRYEILINSLLYKVLGREDDYERYRANIDQEAYKIVSVYNLGIGGTNSGTAALMVQYWMYPAAISTGTGPDVIINSYSTNDSMPPYMDPKVVKEMEKNNNPPDLPNMVMNNVRTSLNRFIRAALQSRGTECASVVSPPLVVFVDDYVGPQQPSVVGELSYNMVMVQLSKWYNTMAISYGDVVRDLVYKDTTDPTFFNGRKWDVHYGPFAHLTTSISLLFASMEMYTNYCDNLVYSSSTRLLSPPSSLSNNTIDNNTNHNLLPPPLTKELLFKSVSNEWEEINKNATEAAAAINNNSGGSSSSNTISKCNIDRHNNNSSSSNAAATVDMNPCMIAWILSPGLFNSRALNNFMRSHSVYNDQNKWKAEVNNGDGWSRKEGWVASGVGASMALEFKDTSKIVNTMTIFYMKSYGEKWENSTARFTVSSSNSSNSSSSDASSKSNQFELSGTNDTPHSLTFPHTQTLPTAIEKGNNIRLKIELVGGTTFKLMGLMLCT